MRRILGTTLLVSLLLAGCGSGSDDPTGAVSGAGDPPAAAATVVSGTAAGGSVEDRATVLEDDAAVAAYAGRFRGPLSERIADAAEGIAAPDGSSLVAAVVAVGCDVPPGAEVVGRGGDAAFVPAKIASPTKECLAPVTSVALAAVPQDGGE